MLQDRIHFVGHACFWITLDGQHFLVDANFSPKILGLIKRQAPLGIDTSRLPAVRALLVTHAHYDHLDIFSYKYFPQTTPIVMPEGLGSLVGRYLHNPQIELKRWAEH